MSKEENHPTTLGWGSQPLWCTAFKWPDQPSFQSSSSNLLFSQWHSSFIPWLRNSLFHWSFKSKNKGASYFVINHLNEQ